MKFDIRPYHQWNNLFVNSNRSAGSETNLRTLGTGTGNPQNPEPGTGTQYRYREDLDEPAI